MPSREPSPAFRFATARTPSPASSRAAPLAALVDHALLSERALDRTFWLDARIAASDKRDARYRAAARFIHATLSADPRRREHAARVLTEPRRAARVASLGQLLPHTCSATCLTLLTSGISVW
jgi:hypothetical protein